MSKVESQLGNRVDIDSGARIMIDVLGTDSKMKSTMIGQVPSEYLIIKMPVGKSGVRSKLYEGNKVTVRYAHHGNVYGFESFILGQVDKPGSMLFLDYPIKIAQASRRGKERHGCYIPCMTRYKDKELVGTILDFSSGGCRCILSEPGKANKSMLPKPDEDLVLTFKSPEDESEMEIDVRVVSATDYHSAARFGMTFNNSEEGIEEKVESLLGFLATH